MRSSHKGRSREDEDYLMKYKDKKDAEWLDKMIRSVDPKEQYSIFDRWQMDQVERDEIRRLTLNEARRR